MIQELLIKILLSPVAIIYGFGIFIRNLFYQFGIIKTASFNVPVIGIGNLSIGGAGKTPHVEYLIKLLSPYIKVATLSRGYKRNTVGFHVVGQKDTALTAGDEPFMYYIKHKQAHIAVAENRAIGIPQLLAEFPDIQTILLDDHFQHRSVKPGLNILLTDYAKPFDQDYLLPVGRLREWPMGAHRADIIIVTKCPAELSADKRKELKKRLVKKPDQKIFYSRYEYHQPYSLLTGERLSLDQLDEVVLVSAIANTDYLKSYVEKHVKEVTLASFEDHHLFSPHEVSVLKLKLDQLSAPNKAILTTEKDASRLLLHKDYIIEQQLNIYLLPITVTFFDEELNFDDTIKSFLLNFSA